MSLQNLPTQERWKPRETGMHPWTRGTTDGERDRKYIGSITAVAKPEEDHGKE